MASRFVPRALTFARSRLVSACAAPLAPASRLALGRFTSSCAGSKAIIGKPAPAISATALYPDGQFKPFNLSQYKGKYFVLFFYPLDFTFVCPTEIIAFSDASDRFKAIGCEMACASVDSAFVHLAWSSLSQKEGGLGGCKIPMIADLNKQVARDYGVLIEDGPNAGVALRGLFIVDTQGTLRQITVNDLPVGRSVDEALRLVQAFQFVDAHGEVCPAGWKPGDKTMKADPKGSKEYFQKVGKN